MDETADRRIPVEFHPGGLQPALQARHQPIGREAAVELVVHRAGDVHADGRLDRSRAGGIEHLCRDAELGGVPRDGSFFFQRVRRLAKHQHPALHEAEIVLARELLEALAARQGEVAQQRRGASHMRDVGGLPELERPVRQAPRRARLDIERRGRVPHPLQAERHHAGRRKRHEMARHHHAAVLVRAAVALGAMALDHRDAPAAARAVERGAQPDDAAADHRDVSRHQRMPQQNGSRSSRSSVLSAVM